VLGKCAQSISRDNTIHIIGCDSRTSSQWRAGADSSLINVAVGRCLTDPSNGRTKGEAVRLSPCTGDANQRFTLPP